MSEKLSKLKREKIILKVKNPINYGLAVNAEIIVSVNGKTEYLNVSQPKVLPQDIKPGESGSLFSQEKIAFSDLKAGDNITAVSSANIKGKTEFIAEKIEVAKKK